MDVRDSGEVGLRERKKVQTRRALHRSAVELVAERGLAQSTVEDIAEAAGVSTRTFFNYFPTKESAVLGIHPEEADDVAGRLRDRPAEETPTEAVRGCLREYAERLAADKGLWRLRRSIVLRDPSMFAALASATTAVERAVAVALAERMGVDAAEDIRPMLLTSVTWAAIKVGLSHSREHNLEVSEALDDALTLLDETH
ncbi:Transcriptional regulator, TetR family [Actinomycetales bacterium JB111]|nr:Transcriptional regulator, TetR family [Actinomycetales bacterium JB111]